MEVIFGLVSHSPKALFVLQSERGSGELKQAVIFGIRNAQHGGFLGSSTSCRQAFTLKFTPTHNHAQAISKTLDKELGWVVQPLSYSPWSFCFTR